MCPGITMARKRPSLDRIQNPRDELQRAIQRAEKGLSGAAGEGFREVLTRVRQAVLDSERLVAVLDRLVGQGLRRRSSDNFIQPSEVQDAIGAVRAAVGALASTTPAKFSGDYDQYNQRARALIAIAQAVLDPGLDSPVKRQELDEWEPFREP